MNKLKIMRITHIFGNQIFLKDNSFKDILNGRDCYDYKMLMLHKNSIDVSLSLANEIAKLGHNVETVYFDLKEMQILWAKENECKVEGEQWTEYVLHEQINKIKPEVIFFQKSIPFTKTNLRRLKKKYPFVKKLIFHTAYLGATWGCQEMDHLLVGTPSLVHRYSKMGLKPELFYHYFDPNIGLNIMENLKNLSEEEYDLTFAGSSGFGGGFLHVDRYEFLKCLLDKTNILMWLLEEKDVLSPSLTFKQKLRRLTKKMLKRLPFRLINTKVLGECWTNFILEINQELDFFKKGVKIPTIPLKELYPSRCYASVHGLDYYRILSKSKISFTKAGNNVHNPKESLVGDIGALRLFEATGLGSCLVSDTGPNMQELFEEGKEIVTYTSKEEAVEKIKYLLSNEGERKKIAVAGQARTLKDHTAAERAKQFDCLLHDIFRRGS
jgi:hypothetical protein